MAYEVDTSSFPKAFRKAYEGLSDRAKAKWKEERYRALTDHLYLSTEVMGMDFQPTPHRWLFATMLKKRPGTPLYDLDLIKKKRLILWSRGTFKTSSIIVEIVQLILNYPDIRIAFLSGGDNLAKRQLARVVKVFEFPTDKFRELFPEFVGGEGEKKFRKNAHHFNVPCQSVSRSYAEPTMAISTARSVKAGSHYDVIFVDDLVNETNYRSQKMLEKSIQDYRDICPLLAPDGFMYITGTRYSFGDLYEEIQEQAKKEQAELGTDPWLISIKSCWVKVCPCGHSDPEHDLDSRHDPRPCTLCNCRRFVDSGATGVLFPKFRKLNGETEGHSVEFLQSEKLRLGGEFFACQYENNPLPEGDQTFTDELLGKQTVWHQEQFPTALQAPCFVMGDLSYVGDESRDMSVLYVVRYWMGQLFAVDCSYGHWDAREVAEELFKVLMKHRPTIIWLEKFPAWESYSAIFDIFARDHKVQRLPIEWKKMSNSKGAKLVRIGSIKGFLAQRRLWLYGHAPGHETLISQLKKWPKSGRHDDFADCLALACECPTGISADALSKATEGISNLSFIRRLNANPEMDSYYDTRIPGTY
jgi:hypothetical protein